VVVYLPSQLLGLLLHFLTAVGVGLFCFIATMLLFGQQEGRINRQMDRHAEKMFDGAGQSIEIKLLKLAKK